jgi:hypothetical protein
MHGGHVFTFQFGLLIVTFESSRPPCWHAHKTHPTHTPVPPNPAVEPPSAERRRGPASAFRYTQCWSLNSVMRNYYIDTSDTRCRQLSPCDTVYATCRAFTTTTSTQLGEPPSLSRLTHPRSSPDGSKEFERVRGRFRISANARCASSPTVVTRVPASLAACWSVT